MSTNTRREIAEAIVTALTEEHLAIQYVGPGHLDLPGDFDGEHFHDQCVDLITSVLLEFGDSSGPALERKIGSSTTNEAKIARK